MSDPAAPRYRWAMLQEGMLTIGLDGAYIPGAGHCTVTAIWPADDAPSPGSTILVDPCFFTAKQYWQAASGAEALGIPLARLVRVFTTHPHHDHAAYVPAGVEARFASYQMIPFQQQNGLQTVPLPGHEAHLQAIVFCSPEGQAVWIVGDAVLNAEWLEAWAYYWPNRYGPPEIVETWRSVARILASADVIVPGHGPAVAVNADLLERLIQGFPQAELAAQCPEVGEALQGRLRQMRREGQA